MPSTKTSSEKSWILQVAQKQGLSSMGPVKKGRYTTAHLKVHEQIAAFEILGNNQ